MNTWALSQSLFNRELTLAVLWFAWWLGSSPMEPEYGNCILYPHRSEREGQKVEGPGSKFLPC
jgi:hypothetical protein